MTQGVLMVPTAEQRRIVKAMAGFGVPHEGIAVMLDIDAKTLRKHFHTELERGSVEATAQVAQSLFQMATQGKNVAAAIFWIDRVRRALEDAEARTIDATLVPALEG